MLSSGRVPSVGRLEGLPGCGVFALALRWYQTETYRGGKMHFPRGLRCPRGLRAARAGACRGGETLVPRGCVARAGCVQLVQVRPPMSRDSRVGGVLRPQGKGLRPLGTPATATGVLTLNPKP